MLYIYIYVEKLDRKDKNCRKKGDPCHFIGKYKGAA